MEYLIWSIRHHADLTCCVGYQLWRGVACLLPDEGCGRLLWVRGRAALLVGA